ncbi:MAG: glycosyltransferase [Longicatena sp.]|uniref:UDP-gal:alpha-D-glcNac-diphosphoundecaprenol beta-1,3-galactosyltransferase n=1 Tax=Hafnia alvei TaxID=569 RepID=A0A172X029_HAFAL|nr:glycosyltransferase [Hafnia paralvei]ANF29962.1 UDP-gal:alpha-D-glcNac-diphosphoundecaprenol beta-1,3-galactosyltransferase [Hafnia alvei]MDX6843121.1 glycosyltransferase [Hafnia paralvei]TBM00678.1 glycosyltransferase [Hafnia paralvei]
MKFSVLLSLYYKEKPNFLFDCLDSILKNTLTPDQVVIVYDGAIGSDLRSVVDFFKDKFDNIKVVELPKNVGLGLALNEGMKHCTNELVARMDTDDVCVPHRFEYQVKYFIENPQVSIVGSSIKEYDRKMNSLLGTRMVVKEHLDIIKRARTRNPFNHMTVMFRKSSVLSAGGYIHHLYMEDYNLWLRMIAKGFYCYNLSESLVNVRAGDDMVARRKGIKYVKSEFLLALLKMRLKIDNPLSAVPVCAIRIFPRLLPVPLLSKLYMYLRRGK